MYTAKKAHNHTDRLLNTGLISAIESRAIHNRIDDIKASDRTPKQKQNVYSVYCK